MTEKTEIASLPASHLARRVSDSSDCECPIGDCGRPAQEWIADALIDGYVDACTYHAQDVMLDAIEQFAWYAAEYAPAVLQRK
jgi:hypothetical protein